MQGPYPSALVPPIFAIDPGTIMSGFVIYDPDLHTIIDKGIEDNCVLAQLLDESVNKHGDYIYAIEMIQCFAMPVGVEVFETLVWIGKYTQIVEQAGNMMHRIFRKDVKKRMCNSMKAKDSNIRQAVIDRFPPSGGGKVRQIGIKSNPGPLYGIGSHSMSALAVALTYNDMELD